MPGAVVDVILGMHHAMTLQYSTSSHSARTATGKGVRQGCRLAPILWSCFTGWLMSRLVPVLSESDLHYLLTLFADDTLCQWEVNDVEQVHRVIKQIGFLLDFLQQHGLRANLDKTVVLAKFVGYRHTKEWKKCTEHHPDKNLCLKVATCSGKVLLPIKTSHKYLGVQLSYHHMARDTVNYRIKCAQASFARLNVALKRTSISFPCVARFDYGMQLCTVLCGMASLVQVLMSRAYRGTAPYSCVIFVRSVTVRFISLGKVTRLSLCGRGWIAPCTRWRHRPLSDIALQQHKRSLKRSRLPLPNSGIRS